MRFVLSLNGPYLLLLMLVSLPLKPTQTIEMVLVIVLCVLSLRHFSDVSPKHDESFMDHSCLSAAHGTGRRQLLLTCALGLVKPFIDSAF